MNPIPAEDSVAMYVPKEYFDELSQVIRVGLQEAKISREARKNLTGWWDAESSFITDDLKKQDKVAS
jgi:hypothetical protein